MTYGLVAATQIVADAWAVLVVGAGIVLSVLGSVLTITFHLGNRIDGQSDRIDRLSEETALVRERVARLESLGGAFDAGSLPSPA
ncbi:hypothetical protein [Candidatus Poriferisodalis sp.]|uniref:hypothetical protein n=1 Tax=Candidatus Poriferisodalis sp. TaxID=3101277 RepID=UPI003B02D830